MVWSRQYPSTRYLVASSGGCGTTPSSGGTTPSPLEGEGGERGEDPSSDLCGGGETAVDGDDLPGDEGVADDEVDDGDGHVVRGHAALERSRLRPPLHQAL